MKNPQIVSPPQKGWLPLVLLIILTIGSLIISVISLYLGWTTIFQNLFYFPIIIACVYYVKRGFVLSVLLACGYFVLMLTFSNDPVVLQGALIRVLIFILVAGVITYLVIIRIRAEDALKASEEFNRGLVENIPNLVVVYDHDRKIRYVNPAATTTLGYSVEEMVGTDIITYVNPHQHEEIAAATEELFFSDMGKSLEIDLITKAGQHLMVISKGVPLHFQNQPAVLILFADITDRKRAEEVQIASETRYRRLFETAQDGILILDADTGQIVEVNPFLIAFLGFSREQFLGKKIWEIGLFKDIVANKDNFEELQRKESIRYENLPLETADGRNIAVEFVSNVYMVNDKKVIQCNIRDITERKKIEVALNATETRYRRLFETAQDGILILDAETGQIVEVNPFLIAFLGFSREQFLGKKLWEIGLFKDIVANKDNFEELHRKESIRYENLPLETADGRNIAVEFVSNVYMVNDKKVIQCNIRDITERKKLAELINVSLAEKETLLREIHHRVKNNLQIISSILNLQIRKIDDPRTIEVLKDSQTRVQAMALVHEHLYRGKDFSHIDLKNYIAALGKGIFQMYEAGNKGIRFDLNIRDVYVDINTAIPLGLISNELITNSLKYAFKDRKDGKISITATEDPQALTFIVADNGTGMPESITLENQTSLGLRLVRTLTGQLDGTVTIDRSEGTKFTFTIPKVAGTKGKE
jgi:PAS domain S-box-containing protein